MVPEMVGKGFIMEQPNNSELHVHYRRNIKEEDEQSEPLPIADEWMKRGEFLRQLRQLEKDDEAERKQQNDMETTHKDQQKDKVYILENGKRALDYNSYLQHQRYYDDLKHVDFNYINYGSIVNGDDSGSEASRLVIEQDKSLGKGGLCWDAAFILAEYLIQTSTEWNRKSNSERRSVVELGSGTGLCGLMVAKSVDCHVNITDLPQLLPLMTRNVKRNFDSQHIIVSKECGGDEHDDDDNDDDLPCTTDDYNYQEEVFNKILALSDNANESTTLLAAAKHSCGTVSTSVLEWGVPDTYQHTYDTVIGADVVASLYDPIALAETIHALCHSHSIVYISYKGRLTGPHSQFEERLSSLFSKVDRIQPSSRNRNPDVFILKATGK